MEKTITGIHHITAIASDAQANVDFYAGTLGLRLVKLTVNFDDPGSYHLYYGDELGRPGSIMTFFAWPGAPRGRMGTGQVTATTFAVPFGALPYWRERLEAAGVIVAPAQQRFGAEVLTFGDPDGMRLEVIETDVSAAPPVWDRSAVPVEYAIRGFHSATLAEVAAERTGRLLTGSMGFRLVAQEDNRSRYETGTEGLARLVDVLAAPGSEHGLTAAGTVHHIAYGIPDDAAQTVWRQDLQRVSPQISPVMDRTYFHSIYFREPGGVLFEIATNEPGFAVDEAPEDLGTKLMLPPWLEASRERIEKHVPLLVLPRTGELVGGGISK